MHGPRTDRLVVALISPVMATERRGRVVPVEARVNSCREDERVTTTKPFVIPKRLVWEAYQRVKANEGAAGVDGQTIEKFELTRAGTSTGSGTGCRRGAIFLRRSRRYRFRRSPVGSEYLACRRSATGLRRPSSLSCWSPYWSRSFTTTRTATGAGNRRTMRSR